MIEKREAAFLWGGKPIDVNGRALQVGEVAPDFRLPAVGRKMVSLADFEGQVKVISVVPSLDTGVCDAQTRRFDKEAADLGEDVVILTVSAEHPINQARWCGASGIERVIVLSDHMDMGFGDAYGTHVLKYRLEQRAVFVVGRDGRLAHVEYVPEIGREPDYERALAAVAEAVGA